jgi:geranyl-CoA carboxylase alpha subunit
MKTPFTALLIANRGEIACRIMRSARAQGLSCIAVYTDADADAPHVGLADQSVNIGAGPARQSYLSIARLLAAAREGGAEAIHPGYGFLSESAEFAQACLDAGLVFVGPSPDAMARMGDKAAARPLMQKAGVPCLPGYNGADQFDATLLAQAGRIGYPVMIKAAAGGGGRGLRKVAQPADFVDALHLAQAEARAAFGSDQVILEQALINPRHVEMQIIADHHGTVLHLGERDCSVQRRHQKVVEESPCPVMTPKLRAAMGAVAVRAAQAIGYEGVGTVEFLLDASGGFHFLEMNTRLQVEHPVTEMLTGLDLVALQLAVAQGDPLGFTQSDVVLEGHAIEARLYAEDPDRGFMPGAGDIALWQPGQGPGIRVDDGIRTGQGISPLYDPMLAKIIAHGATRQEARLRLIAALGDTALFGLTSNRDFLIDVLSRPAFASGQATTGFVAQHYGDLTGRAPGPVARHVALASALIYRARQADSAMAAIGVADELLGWSSSGRLTSVLRLSHAGRTHAVTLWSAAGQPLTVSVDGMKFVIEGQGGDLRIDGQRADLRASLFQKDQVHFATGDKTVAMTLERPGAGASAASADGLVTAPMHGRISQVLVAVGDRVRAGSRLAVLEAMKMQHELRAEAPGRVKTLLARSGQQVGAGEALLEIEIEEPGAPAP